MKDLPREIRDLFDGIARLDVSGRVSGDLETPGFEDLRAHLEHASGASLSLRGHLALGRPEGGLVLTELGASAEFSSPGPALLEQVLGTPMPDLGAIHATAELSWEDGWVTLRSLAAEAESFGAPRLSAKGRVGRFVDGTLDLDPQLDLSASLERSGPLVALLIPPPRRTGPPPEGSGEGLVLLIQQGLESSGLNPGPTDGLMGPRTRAAIEAYQSERGLTVDGRATEALLRSLRGDQERGQPPAAAGAAESREASPDLGPVTALGRLSGRDGTYRLDDLRLTLGAKDALWIEASGNLETLRPGAKDSLEGLALTVSFALPSSQALPWLFPPEVPELKAIAGRFDVQGSPMAFSISGARLEAEGPDGLTGTAAGRLATLSLAPEFGMKGLEFELTAE